MLRGHKQLRFEGDIGYRLSSWLTKVNIDDSIKWHDQKAEWISTMDSTFPWHSKIAYDSSQSWAAFWDEFDKQHPTL